MLLKDEVAIATASARGIPLLETAAPEPPTAV
jgi:hypothetical protein